MLIIAASWFVGCGSNEPFDYVPVSGTIMYDDGTMIPAASIRLTFISQTPPIDAKTHPRPADASVNVADGTFASVTSRKPGDGLIPGKHKVLITATDTAGKPSSAVPKDYTSPSTTPLEVDTADAPLQLRVLKPSG